MDILVNIASNNGLLLDGAKSLPRLMLVYINNKNTVKPVCNDHLSNKIYYLWFIQ